MKLAYDDGTPIESATAPSWIFKSTKTEKFYWIGTISSEGVATVGNFPRHKLFIGEHPVTHAVVRSSLTLLDERNSFDPIDIEISNFHVAEQPNGDLFIWINRGPGGIGPVEAPYTWFMISLN